MEGSNVCDRSAANARKKRKEKMYVKKSLKEEAKHFDGSAVCFQGIMCKCNDNTGPSKKHSCVQLPPKKRKISCDFLHQDCTYPNHQLDNGTVHNNEHGRHSKEKSLDGIMMILSSADIVENNLKLRPSANQTTRTRTPTSRTSINVSSDEAYPYSNTTKSKNEFCTTNKVEEEQTSERRQLQKKQNKYIPDRPMSSEEMKAWRKEARRLRNRQSAAASREKIRNRIVVLEAEVENWKSKHELVMEKIRSIEAMEKT